MRCLIVCAWSLAMGAMSTAAAQVNPASAKGMARNVLTNEGVVLLAEAGYSEGFIIDLIHHKQTQFDVCPEALAWLAKQGLSERIVRAMIANERKEEQTAIVPALISVGSPERPAAKKRDGSGQGTAQIPVQVAVPVLMPLEGIESPAWTFRRPETERRPNIPALAARPH